MSLWATVSNYSKKLKYVCYIPLSSSYMNSSSLSTPTSSTSAIGYIFFYLEFYEYNKNRT